MKLTRERALELHYQMWVDMLAELGETGKGDSYNTLEARGKFKREWCEKHLSGEIIKENCLLCEYAQQEREENDYSKFRCHYCPIDWGFRTDFGCETNETIWSSSPISEILALPERTVE